MNFNEMWDWQGRDYCLEDYSSLEMSKLLFSGGNQSAEEHLSSMFNYETTPIRACGDLAYHVTEKGKEREQIDPSSQAKRRRMLQFESEVLDELLCNDEIFLRSKETKASLKDAISEMSHWVAGFSEGASDSSNEALDPSSEGWIANCFNDAEMLFCSEEEINNTSGASDVQIDIAELCNDSPEQGGNAGKGLPVCTHQNVIFKGRKSNIHATPKLASSVVYPFAFIKPCGAHGDTTLKDINERIHNPPKPNPHEEEYPISYPTSAFSGKPVVGKTKIRTEGGRGSITIMRTKG